MSKLPKQSRGRWIEPFLLGDGAAVGRQRPVEGGFSANGPSSREGGFGGDERRRSEYAMDHSFGEEDALLEIDPIDRDGSERPVLSGHKLADGRLGFPYASEPTDGDVGHERPSLPWMSQSGELLTYLHRERLDLPPAVANPDPQYPRVAPIRKHPHAPELEPERGRTRRGPEDRLPEFRHLRWLDLSQESDREMSLERGGRMVEKVEGDRDGNEGAHGGRTTRRG